MKAEDWNAICAEYSVIRDSRRDSAFAAVKERLKCSDAGQGRLLDYGGGDGLFALACAELPFEQITVFDPAPNMCAVARKNCGSAAHINVVQSSRGLPDGDFDAITLNAVWMCLSTETECMSVLRDVFRLLKSDGLIIALVTHPCFRDKRFSTYWTDFNMNDYLRDGAQFNVTISDGKNEIQIVDTHWCLSTMSNQLKRAGFVITELFEIPDHPVTDAAPWLVISGEKAVDVRHDRWAPQNGDR